MTRVLARLERTVELMALDWNLLYACQQDWSRCNNWSGLRRANPGNDGYESVDGDDDIVQEVHSRLEHGERHVLGMRRREMEAKVIIPPHGPSTKDFLSDVIRGWPVLQKSVFSESSKKTMLGSVENMLGRSRIAEAHQQQWPEPQLLVCGGCLKETVFGKCWLTLNEKQTKEVRDVSERCGNRPRLEHERVDGCM